MRKTRVSIGKHCKRHGDQRRATEKVCAFTEFLFVAKLAMALNIVVRKRRNPPWDRRESSTTAHTAPLTGAVFFRIRPPAGATGR